MLEQVSTSVKFLAFFTASKTGKTGLTVTVDLYDPSGTQIVTGGSATALGGGLYSYTLSTNNSAEGEYAAIFKTTDATVDSQHIPSLWVLGRAGVENLDAVVSSRLAGASYTAPTAAPTVTAIRQEMDSNSTKLANLDTTVSSRLAPSGTLAVVTTLTNAPASVTPAQIRAEMDANSTKLANLDVATSTRLAGSAYTAPSAVPTAAQNATAVWGAATKEITGGTVTTLTNAPSVPSAASIRAEIDSNSTQLAAIKAKTDALNTDRLAQCSTVSTTGAQLAAALS